MKSIFVRYICRMLIGCMGAFPFSTYAGMVGTDQVVAAAQAQGARDKLRDLIGRSEVRNQLQNYGISATAAQARVSAMTDAEVASLTGQIDSLPAGGTSGWAIAAGLIIIGLIWYYWVKKPRRPLRLLKSSLHTGFGHDRETVSHPTASDLGDIKGGVPPFPTPSRRSLPKARAIAGFAFVLCLLAGCISLPQTEALRADGGAGLRSRVELDSVPFFAQEEYQCGPAALAMALNAAGVAVTPDALTDEVYLPGRKGSLQVEMLASARRHGLLAYELAPELRDVLAEVAAGNVVIVLQNQGLCSFYPYWHYAVVIGYDLEKNQILLHSGARARRPLPLGLL